MRRTPEPMDDARRGGSPPQQEHGRPDHGPRQVRRGCRPAERDGRCSSGATGVGHGVSGPVLSEGPREAELERHVLELQRLLTNPEVQIPGE